MKCFGYNYNNEDRGGLLMKQLEDTLCKFKEEDIYYFVHMAYIAGVLSAKKEIHVSNVDTLSEHLLSLFPAFRTDKKAAFYELVGSFAEKNIEKNY